MRIELIASPCSESVDSVLHGTPPLLLTDHLYIGALSKPTAPESVPFKISVENFVSFPMCPFCAWIRRNSMYMKRMMQLSASNVTKMYILPLHKEHAKVNVRTEEAIDINCIESVAKYQQ
jgi:hypothetical protein